MVKAKLIDIIDQNDIRYFKIMEYGTMKTGTYSENDVYRAISKGLIQIKDLSISNKTDKVTVSPRFLASKIHAGSVEVEMCKSNKKKLGAKEKLETDIRRLEKKLESTTNNERKLDIKDEIIRKRRELCKLKGIETDNPNNIYTRLHKRMNRNKNIQVG